MKKKINNILFFLEKSTYPNNGIGAFFYPRTHQMSERIWAGDLQAIKNSRFLFSDIDIFNLNIGPDIQLASNGKIYFSIIPDFGLFGLGEINKPNLKGLDCDISSNERLEEGFYKFPAFFHHSKIVSLKYKNACEGMPTSFWVEHHNVDIDSVLWNFGDPSSGSDNFSNLESPEHLYPNYGLYTVSLKVYSGCKTYTRKENVYIAFDSFDLGNDTTVCSNRGVSLQLPSSYQYDPKILWSDSSTGHFIYPLDSGTYWIQIELNDCPLITDTIVISHIPSPSVNLGPNGEICEAKPISILNATCQNCTYQWNNGSTDPILTISSTGFYKVTATLPNGCTATDDVTFFLPEFELDKQEKDLTCFEDSSGLARIFVNNGNYSPYSFLWENGDTTYFRNDLFAGTYSVTVSDGYGCTQEEVFTIGEPEELVVNYFVKADDPNTPEAEGVIQLEASGGAPPLVFDWEDFGIAEDLIMNNLNKGIYPLTVTDSKGCAQYLEIEVDELSPKEILDQIQIYPNPTDGDLLLEINRKLYSDGHAKIINALGQEVLDFTIKKEFTKISLDLKSLASGTYFLLIKFESEQKILKIIRN